MKSIFALLLATVATMFMSGEALAFPAAAGSSSGTFNVGGGGAPSSQVIGQPKSSSRDWTVSSDKNTVTVRVEKKKLDERGNVVLDKDGQPEWEAAQEPFDVSTGNSTAFEVGPGERVSVEPKSDGNGGTKNTKGKWTSS